MSPEAIDGRLRDVGQLYQLCRALMSAKRLGTVAEVRERERLEAEAAADHVPPTTLNTETTPSTATTTNAPLNEDSPR